MACTCCTLRDDLLAEVRRPADEGRLNYLLVVIGIEMNERALRRRLNACLLTDEEMRGGVASWRDFPNPFPCWVVQNAEESVA